MLQNADLLAVKSLTGYLLSWNLCVFISSVCLEGRWAESRGSGSVVLFPKAGECWESETMLSISCREGNLHKYFCAGKKHLAKLGGKGKEQQPLGFLVVSTWGILEAVQFGVHTVSRTVGLLSYHAWMGWICRLARDLCWAQCDRNGPQQP